MEYKHLKKLKEKFVSKSDEVVLTNPIEKYNYFIQNYNVNYNKIDNIELKSVPFQTFYTICFLIQSRIINLFIILVVIPGILLVGKEYLDHNHYHFNIIIYIYYFILISCSFTELAIYLVAKRIYKHNSKIIANPFQKMVFHPDICREIVIKHLDLSLEGNY